MSRITAGVCRLDRSSIDVNNSDKKKVIHIDVKNFT